MRHTTISVAALAGLTALASAAAVPFVSDYTAPSVKFGYTNLKKATVNGRLFNLNGGATYFAGTNAWWLPYLTESSDVDLVLSEIAGVRIGMRK